MGWKSSGRSVRASAKSSKYLYDLSELPDRTELKRSSDELTYKQDPRWNNWCRSFRSVLFLRLLGFECGWLELSKTYVITK